MPGYTPMAPNPYREQLAQTLIGQGLKPQITATGWGGALQGIAGLAQVLAGNRIMEQEKAAGDERQAALKARLAEAFQGQGGQGNPAMMDLAFELDPTGATAFQYLNQKAPDTRRLLSPEEEAQFGLDTTGQYQTDQSGQIYTIRDPEKAPWTGAVRSPDGAGWVTDPQYLADQERIRAAGKTTVTVAPSEEQTAFEKEYGKLLAEDYAGIQKAGANAPVQIGNYQRLGALLSQINTGAFKGKTTDLKKAVKAFGVDLEALGITDDTAPVDAARAITGQLALELRNPAGGAGMPGAMSDQDRQFLQSMIANIETSPEAIPLMITAAVKVQQRNQEVAQLARDYRRENGGVMDDGFYAVLQEYSAANPLFTEADAAAIGNLNQSPPAPQGGVPTFQSPDDPGLAALPSGATFYDANGVLRVKP